MIKSIEYHGKVLSDSVELVSTTFKQELGLMFRLSLPETHSLLFILEKSTPITVHMLFVFFSIDVIFLDYNQKIIGFSHLKPFFGFASMKNISYIIEIKSGTIQKFNLKLGKMIEFK